jgi:hypothetical protein
MLEDPTALELLRRAVVTLKMTPSVASRFRSLLRDPRGLLKITFHEVVADMAVVVDDLNVALEEPEIEVQEKLESRAETSNATVTTGEPVNCRELAWT